MEVKINKEIQDYSESVFFGLSILFSLTGMKPESARMENGIMWVSWKG